MKHEWIAFAEMTPTDVIPLRHGHVPPGVKFQVRCYVCGRKFCLLAMKEDCLDQIERVLTKSKRLSWLGLPLKLATLHGHHAGAVAVSMFIFYFNSVDAVTDQIPILNWFWP